MIVDTLKAMIASIEKPYWFAPLDEFEWRDFVREIVEPGTNETFPAGAVGIRCDDDFWTVAALPYEFRYYDFETVVDLLWPEARLSSCVPFFIGGDHGSDLRTELVTLQEERRGLIAALYRDAALIESTFETIDDEDRHITFGEVKSDIHKWKSYTATYNQGKVLKFSQLTRGVKKLSLTSGEKFRAVIHPTPGHGHHTVDIFL